jgi:hypothetical protein
MKTIKRTSTVVVFLTILSLAVVQHAIADPNSNDSSGLYYVSASATGQTLKKCDGTSVSLGKRAEIQIHYARIYSRNNANTEFEVYLETSAYPVDSKTGVILEPVVLRVGDHVYSPSGGSGTTGSYNTISFDIRDRSEADAAAKSLSADYRLRNPLGYRFLTQFIPVQSQFTTNQPVLVKLKVKNLDDRTIAFQRGGHQRGARDNQYRFQAMLYGQPVVDSGNPINFGGLCRIVSVEPGKEFEDQVDLRKWFKFDKAGTYFIHGFYQLDFFSLGEKADGLAPWNWIWEDYAAADFQVVIK